MSTITIRTLHLPEEMDVAVRLQQVYWGQNVGDSVPSHMLLSIARYGGHVHAAFDGDRMVGLMIGFLGAKYKEGYSQCAADSLCIMSKRLVVLPEYRGQKIGEQLKWAQRDFALQHGIPLVQWTYDPMLSRNAHLNLHKLRGIVQEYEENYFGAVSVHPTMRADRLVVDWWVDHPHVNQPSAFTPETLVNAQILNSATLNSANLLVPGALHIPQAETLLVEIPLEFIAFATLDPELEQVWRDHVREAFTMLLAAGFVATDFVRFNPGVEEDRGYYVFENRSSEYFHQSGS